MKDIEKEISKAFEKLSKKHNVAFVFSYSYTEGQSADPADIKGRTGVYGSKEVVDILMEELEPVIKKDTKDNFVNV